MVNEMSARKAVPEELSREKIMGIARKMFVESGYRGASMRKIAQELGYSHGAIYYHFKDKAELFCAIVAHDFSDLTGILEQLINAPANPEYSKLQMIFLGFIEYGFTHKSQYELMFLIDDPDLYAYSQTEKNESYDKFAKAVFHALGITGEHSPGYAMIPWTLFLALHGFVSYYLHTEQTYEDIEPLAKVHAKFLEAGLISMF